MPQYKLTFFILISATMLTLESFAQGQPQKVKAGMDFTQDGAYKNVVRMNLLNALFSYPTFSYERFLNGNTSLMLEGSFRTKNNSAASGGFSGNNSRAVNSLIITPSVRFYIHQNKKLKMNAYFSAYYRYRSFRSENDLSENGIYDPNSGLYTPANFDNTYTETSNSGGLMLGAVSNATSRIVFDVYLGTQIVSSSGSFRFEDKNMDYDLFRANNSPLSAVDVFSVLQNSNLRAGFTIGFKF